MGDGFELLDPAGAKSFLQRFTLEAKRKGELCYRQGGVSALVGQQHGAAFSAQVQMGSRSCEVWLQYNHETQEWGGSCSCDKQDVCEHMYAAMSEVLAEHSAALVRDLSSGTTQASQTLAKRAPAAEKGLVQRLQAATGTALSREQRQFVRQIQHLYQQASFSHGLNSWELQSMGLFLPHAGWKPLKVWPSFPENEYLFWLYLANALVEHGQSYPAFMDPITDLELIAEPLARWRRSQEIETWRERFNHIEQLPHLQSSRPEAAADLRLVIEKEVARLEWRRAGRLEFEPLKTTHFRQLLNPSTYATRPELLPEAELLWRFCAPQGGPDYYSTQPEYSYDTPQVVSCLGQILRLDLLQSRVVNAQGEPLQRPPKPLHWIVQEPQDDDGNYEFALVQADNTPAPEVLCVLPGHPTLYLTAQAVFSGPHFDSSELSLENKLSIPAPAIAQPSGVAFFKTLGVSLPPRLEQRIEHISYQVVVTCELQPLYAESSVENCVLSVEARAADGHQQVFQNGQWQNTSSKSNARKKAYGRTIPVYDSAPLAAVPQLLAPLELKADSYRGQMYLRVTKKFPELFSAWLHSLPPEIKVELVGDLASFAQGDVVGQVRLDVTEADIDWFDLRVVLDVADTTLTPAEIKLLLNARGRYVRLEGKGWRRLQYNLTEDENERLARLGLSPHELSAEPQRLHALQLADEAAKKFLPSAQVEQIQRRASEIKTRVAPPLPAGITAQLRPYQVEGFHFLAYLAANRFGGILADDMGLGKTLQTLAWLLWLQQEKKGLPAPSQDAKPPAVAPSLVVCPKSVMDNWQAEAAQFAPGLRVRLWAARDLRHFAGELASADIHVVNYSQLRTLSEAATAARWLALVLDEGQYIKNPTSQTAQVARALHAEHRLVLSGTPIENRLLDLWSLMAFAMPGILGNRAQFGRTYDSVEDPLARRRLSSRVRPFVLRRTKSQVATDLPARIEEDLFCEIEGEQKTLYRAELKRAQQLLLRVQTPQELAQQQFNFLTALLRLRQICCHPRLLKGDSAASSAKAEALLEHLEPLMDDGQKVLIFSQFVEMLNLLRPELEARKWPVFFLAGETENRGELVRCFQKAEGPAVFLISLKAGGFGLNLTAASYVMLFDPWWNPAVENQAIDRTHRIGQTQKVIAYRLLIKNSIEEKIRSLQKQKRALAEDVLGEEKFAQSLTLQDFRFLFAD